MEKSIRGIISTNTPMRTIVPSIGYFGCEQRKSNFKFHVLKTDILLKNDYIIHIFTDK